MSNFPENFFGEFSTVFQFCCCVSHLFFFPKTITSVVNAAAHAREHTVTWRRTPLDDRIRGTYTRPESA